MATRIYPSANHITIQTMRWTYNQKAVFTFQAAYDTFDGTLLDEEGQVEDNPHMFELEEEIECTVCKRTFRGKIYIIPENLGGEQVTYTAYDFLHELERENHDRQIDAYNVPAANVIDKSTQKRNIRQILEREFADADFTFDWDELNQVEGKYPYEFQPPNYKPGGKNQLQVVREVLAFNPALVFYGHVSNSGDKVIKILNAAEFSNTTFEVDFRGYADNKSVQITTDSSQKYNKVKIKAWGEVHERTESPEKIWRQVVRQTDVDAGDYPSADLGLDKRPGLIDNEDPGVAYDPQTQAERYAKYKLQYRIFPHLLRKIGERDTTDDDPDDIELNDDGKVDIIGDMGKVLVIRGPAYEFYRADFHQRAYNTEWDEDKEVDNSTPHYIDATKVLRPKLETVPDPDNEGQTKTQNVIVDYGEASKFTNVEIDDDQYCVFWTKQPMAVRQVIEPNRTRRNYKLTLYREIGHEKGGSADPTDSDDVLRVTYPAITSELEYELEAKDGKGTGTKEIFVNYVKYYGLNEDGEEALIWDDTEDMEVLAQMYRDFYCRAKVSGSFEWMQTSWTRRLPFWLGWNVGVADGAVKSIDLAKVLTDHTVEVTMESHHFGAQDNQWNQNISKPASLNSDNKKGTGAGASTAMSSGEDRKTSAQAEQGVTAQLSQASEKNSVITGGKPLVVDTSAESSGVKDGVVQARKPNEDNSELAFNVPYQGIGSADEDSQPGMLDFSYDPFIAKVSAAVEPGDTVGTEDGEDLYVKDKTGFTVLAYMGTDKDSDHIAMIIRTAGGGVPQLYVISYTTSQYVYAYKSKADGTASGDLVQFVRVT